jgi:hypothetical protein
MKAKALPLCRKWLERILSVAALLTLAACSSEQDPVEARVRALIGQVEHSIENRSVREAVNYLHADYTDPRHIDRRSAGASLFGLVQRHRTIHLFSLIETVKPADDQASAEAVVYVAMTGVPVESIDALISLKADLYRFELGMLEEGGEWRVIRSRWERVDPRVL